MGNRVQSGSARERGGPTRTLGSLPSALSSPAALSLRSDSGLALACWLQSLCPLPCPRRRPSLGPLALAVVSGSGGHLRKEEDGKEGGRAALAVSPVAVGRSTAAEVLQVHSCAPFRFGGSGNGNGNCPGRRPGPGELTTDLSHCQCVALSRSLLCKRAEAGSSRSRVTTDTPSPGRARLEGRCSAQQEHGPIRRNSPRQPWKFPWHRPFPKSELNLSSSWVVLGPC
ncbi:hypothetical protein QR685DRAFT_221306 [Neurospora intermedia]|uniref:Uncharacterized protein n=1 Tax=Neurospora intermedia TaxID=5142 RepID=A0ABR3DH28_NEUIN